MRFIEEPNRLLKIKLFPQSNNQWRILPVTKRDGEGLRKGQIMFRGTDEKLKLLFKRLHVKDNKTDPPSVRGTTYQAMIDSARDGSDPYIWVELQHWKKFRNDTKLVLGEKVDILNTFTNKEDGIESYVSKHDKGFSVTLKDIDADEFLPSNKIFPDKNKAIAYAKKLVEKDYGTGLDLINFNPSTRVSTDRIEKIFKAEDIDISHISRKDVLVPKGAGEYAVAILQKNGIQASYGWDNYQEIVLDKDLKIGQYILEKGDKIKIMREIYHHQLNMDLEKHTLDALRKKQVNRALSDISSPPYYKEIPLDEIFEILRRQAIIPLQEDLKEWSGFLTGVNGEAELAIGDYLDATNTNYGLTYKPYTNSILRLSWYKMTSGKYEIVCYLS